MFQYALTVYCRVRLKKRGRFTLLFMQAYEVLGETPLMDNQRTEVITRTPEDCKKLFDKFWDILARDGARGSKLGFLVSYLRHERYKAVIVVKHPRDFPGSIILFGFGKRTLDSGHSGIIEHQLIRVRFYMTPHCRVVWRENSSLLYYKDKQPLISSSQALINPELRINGYGKYVFAKEYGTYADISETYVTLGRPWQLIWKDRKDPVEETAVYGIYTHATWHIDTRYRGVIEKQEAELKKTWHPAYTPRNQYYICPCQPKFVDLTEKKKRPWKGPDTSSDKKETPKQVTLLRQRNHHVTLS